MIESHQIPAPAGVVETMIQLARATTSHRVIVAGSDAFDVYMILVRRGFSRAATTATCRLPCGQHDVGLIAGQHSVQALEALLGRVVPFLTSQAILAVWVGFAERRRALRLQALLERMGFRIEVGTKCEGGFILAARRDEWNHAAVAA